MKKLILAVLRFYKKYFSWTLGACRFTPTCSEYTYEAISKYGTISGLWLGLRRILRCNAWNKSGLDPVP